MEGISKIEEVNEVFRKNGIDLTQEDRAKNEFEKLIDDEIKFWSITKSHIPPNLKVLPEEITISTTKVFDIVREYVLFELKFLRDKITNRGELIK